MGVDAPQPQTALSIPELLCHKVMSDAPDIVPARSERDWMNATRDRYAYRCLPLSIANASGWEIILPCSFDATYFGGDELNAIELRSTDGSNHYTRFASSHFGSGILTFQTGYLFRTSPGWAIWARGLPNTHRDKIVPLEGLIETDWTTSTFTMNWRFTRPGTARFNKGDPFCFLTLAPHATLDLVEPRLLSIDDDPSLKIAHDEWSAERTSFNARLHERDPATVAQAWQRTYMRGETHPDAQKPTFHVTKRRLKTPR